MSQYAKVVASSLAEKELFRMAMNSDMIEICDAACLERHHEIIRDFVDAVCCVLPTTCMLSTVTF